MCFVSAFRVCHSGAFGLHCFWWEVSHEPYSPFCFWAQKPSQEKKKKKKKVWFSYCSYLNFGVCVCVSCSVVSDSLWPRGQAPLFIGFSRQERILERVAISSSRGSSWPKDWTQVSCIAGGFLILWVIREALNQLYSNTKWKKIVIKKNEHRKK